MTPAQFDEWLTYFEKTIAAHLPARDHVIYRVGLLAGVAVFVVNHPNILPPGWSVPPEWAKWVNDVSAGVAILSAKFGWSSAKAPKPDTTVADAPAPMVKGAA